MRSKTYKFLALFCLAVGFSISVNAQEVQFSQFYASSLYLNPAFAGMEQSLSFNTNVRTQFQSSTTNSYTSQISTIIPVLMGSVRKEQVGGIGISMFSDGAGASSITTTGLRATFAYSKALANDMHKFSLGVQGGFTQSSIDVLNAKWGSQFNPLTGYDPSLPYTAVKPAKYYVVNAGLIYSFNPSRNYYRAGTSGFGGISISNLAYSNPKFFDNGATPAANLRVIKVHGGLELHASRNINFGPQLLVASQQLFGTQINAGMYINYRLNESPYGLFGNSELVLGIWQRLKGANIVSLGITNANYTVGFSVDGNISSSNIYTINSGTSAYELSFSIRNAKDRKRRRFDTPRI